jgi:hypothetical protein
MTMENTTDTKPPASPPLTPATGSASLARQAYEYGKRVAMKANGGLGYDRKWAEVPEPTKKGFLAMTRFIIRAMQPNARADLPRIEDANRESGCEGDNRG